VVGEGRGEPPCPGPVVREGSASSGASPPSWQARPISKWTSTRESISRFIPDFGTNLDPVPAAHWQLRDSSRIASSSQIPFPEPPSITRFDPLPPQDGASLDAPSGGGRAGGTERRPGLWARQPASARSSPFSPGPQRPGRRGSRPRASCFSVSSVNSSSSRTRCRGGRLEAAAWSCMECQRGFSPAGLPVGKSSHSSR